MASITEANSLFEIDVELDGLLEEIELQIEVEGQPSDELVARFQEFCEARGEKVDRIGRFVRMMEAREQFCRSEATRLGDRARGAASKIQRTKNMALYYLLSRDLKKIEGQQFTLRAQKNSQDSVKITDQAAVPKCYCRIEARITGVIWETVLSLLPDELHTSHLGFFHASARRASSRAALSATYLADQTPYGNRWIFQDVHAGGAAAIAGIEPGDVLLGVAGQEIVPPDHPVFAMGKQTDMEVVDKDNKRRVVLVEVARPKGKKLHFIEPKLVETRRLGNGTGYLKVAMFPDVIGVKVANEISAAIESLGTINRLIIDLRGNTGGGMGALRVMSFLTPAKVPVGFAAERRRINAGLESEKHSFKRFSRIPSSTNTNWWIALQFAPTMMMKRPVVLETEGLGAKSFHGRITLLVDRHTASAAEMIVAFARENGFARIVGEKTAGRLLSATSVKVGNGFRLAMPTGAYYTWNGSVLEGTPIEPDELVEFDWQERRSGKDRQLERAQM